jgi:HNH endonuclease
MQREWLHAVINSNPHQFNITPNYAQHDGTEAPLWPTVTIAAKGVAEHIVGWAQGGRTDASNLTNACSACNYRRNDTSIDAIGAPAYTRRASELNRLGQTTPSEAPPQTA